MSGPIVKAVTESIRMGVDEIWAGGNRVSEVFGKQSYKVPGEFARWMDGYVMRTCVRGEQVYLVEYPR